MRGAYADVTRWVGFNISMALRELQKCNDGWIAPHVNLFLEELTPGSRRSGPRSRAHRGDGERRLAHVC